MVAAFIADIAVSGRVASASLALAAVSSLHVDAGLDPPPRSAELRRILKGALAISAWAKRDAPSHRRLPVSFPMLLVFMRDLRSSSLASASLRCIFSFMFFGLLRAGEVLVRASSRPSFACLRVQDVQDRGSHLILRLPSSKSSQWRSVEVVLGAVAQSPADPVGLFRTMLEGPRGPSVGGPACSWPPRPLRFLVR